VSKASYSKLQNQYITQCRQSEDYRLTTRDSDAAVYELRQAAELTRIEIARYAQEKEEQEEQLHRIPHLEAEVAVAQARLDEQKQEIMLLKATIDRMQVDIDDMDRNGASVGRSRRSSHQSSAKRKSLELELLGR
jgi:secreted trypsin-like serine protease